MSTCNLSLNLTHLIFFAVSLCLNVGSWGFLHRDNPFNFQHDFFYVVWFFFPLQIFILCVWLFPWQRVQSRSFIFSSWYSSSSYSSSFLLVLVVLDTSDGASAAQWFAGTGWWGANVRWRVNGSLPRGASSATLRRRRPCRCRVLWRRRCIQSAHQTDAAGASKVHGHQHWIQRWLNFQFYIRIITNEVDHLQLPRKGKLIIMHWRIKRKTSMATTTK